MVEKIILLSVEKTELQCGISPEVTDPSSIIIQPALKSMPVQHSDKGKTMVSMPGLTQDAIPTDEPRMSTAMVPVYLRTEPAAPLVAKRTRSQTEILTPVPPSADSKLVKNYCMCTAFKAFFPGHKFMVNDLVAHNELEGYDLTFHLTLIHICISNNLAMQRYCIVVRRSLHRDNVQRHISLPSYALPLQQRITPSIIIQYNFLLMSYCVPYTTSTRITNKFSSQTINSYSQVCWELQQQQLTDTDLTNPLRGTTYVFDCMLIVSTTLIASNP